uniref:Major facilitator superfamily (MFS) profile domain-containing protein n=1 Tax=Magallana gigas TaxID=29159 RepID=A0A8W8IU53_MAGGI
MATKNAEKSDEDLKEKSRAIMKHFKRSSDPDSSHNSKAEKRRGHPIDKGYAWVVLVACCVAVFLITGTFKSFGVLYVELITVFHSNATMTSVVQGLLIFIYSFGSVFVCLFGLRLFPSRTWVIIGGIFYFFGFLTSSFAESVEFLFFSYSCLIGAGMALSFSPIVVTVGTYFDEKKGFASGLLMSSGSLGALVMAPFLRVLLNLYSVEGALLIIAAVASHIIACGLLLRPTPFYTGKRNKASYESDCSSTEVQGPLVDSLTRDSDQFDRLYSSDPNIVLKKGHFQQVDCPKRRTSNEVVAVFQPNDSKECSLNFERQGSAVVNSTIGTSLPQSYLPAFAMEQGTDRTDAAWLITISSFADLLGRITIGWISDKKRVKRIYLIAISMVVSGVVQCLSPFYKNYLSLVFFSMVYGFFSNFISALYFPVLLDILGLDDFRCALSVLYVGYGIISGCAAPFIGELKDKSGTYVTCFYLFGAAHIISSAVLFSECLS